MYETFGHTADLGLRVVAPDLDTLFAAAGRALFSVIVAEPPTGTGEPRSFRIEGRRLDFLMFDWLNELLFTFDTEDVVLGDFGVKVAEDGLDATAVARPFDPNRQRPLREVKAITYHRLKVEKTDDGWLAEVIVDI